MTSGLYHIWRGQGMVDASQLLVAGLAALSMALICLWAGWFHFHRAVPTLAWFADIDSALNHHLAGLFGLGSIAWAGHIIHVAQPTQALLSVGVDPRILPAPHVLAFSPYWLGLVSPGFSLRNLFGLNWSALGSGLTALGGIDSVTESLWLTDVAHHHLAIGVLCILAGHLYKTDFGLGVAISEIVAEHQLEAFNSWHLQLALQLVAQGSLSVWFGHLLVALPAYPYIATEYATVLSIFTHHQWIGGFFIVGGAAHTSLALIFDCNLHAHPVISHLLHHRQPILVHLNWVCVFLGFHSFGLYVHNDTVAALGRSYDQFSDQGIVLLPVFARWMQVALVLEPTLSVLGPRAAGRVLGLGTADTLVHHVHAFTIHVTALILLKGSLYSRSSRLVPDKASLGFRFPCDGPGRGGTCQVSAWDHIFLGLFWMYNAVSVVIFHFSWKLQSDVWSTEDGVGFRQLTARNFAICSVTINGWLRDFLWSQSSQVIQSYGSFTGAYGLMFLGAHFVWAFSLMFLFSGRGYWQELIESIIWAHQMVATAPAIYPRALSIIQGRAVG